MQVAAAPWLLPAALLLPLLAGASLPLVASDPLCEGRSELSSCKCLLGAVYGLCSPGSESNTDFHKHPAGRGPLPPFPVLYARAQTLGSADPLPVHNNALVPRAGSFAYGVRDSFSPGSCGDATQWGKRTMLILSRKMMFSKEQTSVSASPFPLACWRCHERNHWVGTQAEECSGCSLPPQPWCGVWW